MSLLKEKRNPCKALCLFKKQVKVELDHNNLDEVSSIKRYYVQDVQVYRDYENEVVMMGEVAN